ncbi:MAG: UDP-N-acetylmuramate--L-alanine ligase [Thermoanaerobaculia bacterium]
MHFRKFKKLHFMGIGGSGMCGMAEILHKLGFEVDGCDKSPSPTVEMLKKLGIPIEIGHSTKHIENKDAVVFSSAISKNHPELKEARAKKIPTILRAELLAQMVRLGFAICVAGTHGKTTTTSLIGHLLTKLGADPTIIVGGRVKSLKSHARLGTGTYFVLEADEYDRSFLQLIPDSAVITTIDEDHLDTYGDFENICNAFYQFALKVPFYGSLILNYGDSIQRKISKKIERPFSTYGFSPKADLWAENIEGREKGMGFYLNWKGNRQKAFLPLYGKHNVQNSLGAILLCLELGYNLRDILEALTTFPGVSRRMDLIGFINKVPVIDDYAHHPAEIRETLKGLKIAFSKRKIMVVFQPHLYSRTLHFKSEFAQALSFGDLVVITRIYGAREKEIPGVSGNLILKELKKSGKKNVYYIEEFEQLKDFLLKNLRDNFVLIFMGAGDISHFANNLVGGIYDKAKT